MVGSYFASLDDIFEVDGAGSQEASGRTRSRRPQSPSSATSKLPRLKSLRSLKILPSYVESDYTYEDAVRIIKRTTICTLGGGAILYLLLSSLVTVLTIRLDIRMMAILQALSRLFSAIITLTISVRIPKWLGIFHEQYDLQDEFKDEDCEEIDGSDLKRPTLTELQFDVFWEIGSVVMTAIFYMLPFFAGHLSTSVIPISTIGGIGGGIVLDVFIFVTRRCKGSTENKTRRRQAAISFVVSCAIVGVSILLFFDAIGFVYAVWEIGTYLAEFSLSMKHSPSYPMDRSPRIVRDCAMASSSNLLYLRRSLRRF